MVDRLGMRPSQSKIDAVAQFTRANTVEVVGALLGMTGYLRKFIPRNSALVAPILSFFRDKRLASKGGENSRCHGMRNKTKRWRR